MSNDLELERELRSKTIDELALSMPAAPDKASPEHGYTVDVYQRYLEPLRDRPIRLLEIGVQEGRSLNLWGLVFASDQTQITGVDIDLSKCRWSPPQGCELLQCDINNRALISQIAIDRGPFDVIIDDGSHLAADQLAGFDMLWPHLAPSGLYFVEDLELNYESNVWGPSYSEGSGMVDFLGGELQHALHGRGRSRFARPTPLEAAVLPQLDRELEFIHLYRYIAVVGKRARPLGA